MVKAQTMITILFVFMKSTPGTFVGAGDGGGGDDLVEDIYSSL